MKQDFIDYIKQNFTFSKEEQKQFEESLGKPLKKSLRVNTNKISISDFEKLATKNDWSLTKTNLGENIFYIDREDTSISLGNTPEHIGGVFYIQEVSASSSPFYLSQDKIDKNDYLILDMSASPGGKTTQLSEYYPNSLIIANEIDKTRLKSLFLNIDRMSSLNVVCTNYDGRFFKQNEEIFDKVLLDAPCSGEGTSFKTDDALKYRNIKNIKRIAKLQFGLLESALYTAKIGGEIIYSTCTLNKIENEGVVESILEKYKDFVEIIPLTKENDFKRNWPHKENTGGFFVAKLKKIKSLEQRNNKHQAIRQNLEKLNTNEEKMIYDFLKNNFGYDLKGKYLYKYKNDIFLTNKRVNFLWDKLFLYKIGVNIGEIKNNIFTPYFYCGNFDIFEKNSLKIDDLKLEKLLKGEELEIKNQDNEFIQIRKGNLLIGLGKIKDGKIKSLFKIK